METLLSLDSKTTAPNGEYLLRMNYLCHVSAWQDQNGIASNSGKELKNIAKRHVLRIDPEIKKRLCRRCGQQKEGKTCAHCLGFKEWLKERIKIAN